MANEMWGGFLPLQYDIFSIPFFFPLLFFGGHYCQSICHFALWADQFKKTPGLCGLGCRRDTNDYFLEGSVTNYQITRKTGGGPVKLVFFWNPGAIFESKKYSQEVLLTLTEGEFLPRCSKDAAAPGEVQKLIICWKRLSLDVNTIDYVNCFQRTVTLWMNALRT